MAERAGGLEVVEAGRWLGSGECEGLEEREVGRASGDSMLMGSLVDSLGGT